MTRHRPNRPERVFLATLASGNVMGQQNYEAALLRALRATAPENLVVEPFRVRSWRSELPSEARAPMQALRTDVLRRGAGRLLYRRAAVVHRCDLRLPPAPKSLPEVLTVLDLAPLRFGDEGELPKAALAEMRRAARVVCPSSFSAQEVRAYAGQDLSITVIPLAADPVFAARRPLTVADRTLLGLQPGQEYFFCGGGASQRKNLAGLAGAWRLAHRELPNTALVVAGPPDHRRDALFAGLPNVLRPGLVPRTVQAAAVQSALAAVVPSQYEGFGLPVLEAMTAGTPVLAADCASLPEVCGGAALLTAPTSASMAEGLLALIDPALRARLSAAGLANAAGYSWERTARLHHDVYRSLA